MQNSKSLEEKIAVEKIVVEPEIQYVEKVVEKEVIVEKIIEKDVRRILAGRMRCSEGRIRDHHFSSLKNKDILSIY